MVQQRRPLSLQFRRTLLDLPDDVLVKIIALLAACCAKAVRLSCRALHRASYDAFTHLAPYAGQDVALLIEKFPQLTSLALSDHSLDDYNWCWRVFAAPPRNLSNLEALRLGHGSVRQADCVVRLPIACPRLTALGISAPYFFWRHLERACETRAPARESILLLNRLKDLTVDVGVQWIQWDELLPALTALANLQCLHGVFACSVRCCGALAALTQLTGLAVRFSLAVPNEGLRTALAPLTALLSLDVRGYRCAIVMSIARGLPGLRHFRFYFEPSLEAPVRPTFGFEGSLRSLEHLGLEVHRNVWSALLPQMTLLTCLTLLHVKLCSEGGKHAEPQTYLSSLLRLRDLRLREVVPQEHCRFDTIACLAKLTCLEVLHLEVCFNRRSSAFQVGRKLEHALKGSTRLQHLVICGGWSLSLLSRKALEMELPALGPRTCPCGQGPNFHNV